MNSLQGATDMTHYKWHVTPIKIYVFIISLIIISDVFVLSNMVANITF